ncbi:hypothetical protein LWC34_16720 [Kibdelosporangium philippinense]|uniref:WD40-like Beta Propeller Repeat n=1 Tax=Kibdelosporangium philippinense TaxID=211113 RepID=A0ABS8ZC96_9PSEU|nr:hypothetical protein [Kibdelosporangium philippinense]MCE7004465.1 hypothetical protein [Kibdelosporangium philippinense]
MRLKLSITFVAAVLLAGIAFVYIQQAKATDPRSQAVNVSIVVEQGMVTLTDPGRLLFRNEAPGPDYGKIASVSLSDPQGPRRISQLRCERFYTSAGRGLCLAESPGPLPSATVATTDSSLTEAERIDVAGIPNRAKLSGDGKIASWTTFVTGDSYNRSGTFSTRTGIMTSDETDTNIEDMPLRIGGRQHRAEDVNFWGVTVAADGRTFYATVSTGGQTHLVKGDLVAWSAEAVRENVECPSLSPDGTRVAFKKRIAQDGARPWREYVLDLATMTEIPLAETRSVDDQAIWLDNSTVAYGMPDGEIWATPADGSGAPRLVVRQGSSPSVS